MQLSSKSVGLFEAFYNSAKVGSKSCDYWLTTANLLSQPISLISYSVEVSKSGKIPVGRTEGITTIVLPVFPSHMFLFNSSIRVASEAKRAQAVVSHVPWGFHFDPVYGEM